MFQEACLQIFHQKIKEERSVVWHRDQTAKKIELNFCLACHLLNNCRKNKGRQPTRVCQLGKCDLFTGCEDRRRFANLQLTLDYFKENPDARIFYDIHVSLTCENCRAKEKEKKGEAE